MIHSKISTYFNYDCNGWMFAEKLSQTDVS